MAAQSPRSSLYATPPLATPTNGTGADVEDVTSSDPRLIAQHLLARYSKDKLYTRIGGRSMIALKPVRGSPFDYTSKDYAEQTKDPNCKKPYASHVFNISASAYLHALRGGMDQSIVLLGESGNGKSEIYKMLLKNLCDLSKNAKKKSKVQSHLLKVENVLAAFGHATTPFNHDASCFTHYTEVQFDGKGRMVGAKVIEYLLEKSRVTNPLDGGRSFHIFYYMLEGASSDESAQLQLSDAAHYSYLTGSNLVGFAQGNAGYFQNLKDYMKSLGIGRRQQAQVWKILAAILHLGNVQFRDALPGQESCTVKNIGLLNLVAEMLGLDPSSLLNALTSRTRTVGKDNIFEVLDAKDSANQRDSFARSLYATTFSWIVEQINRKLCAPETGFTNFVGILEIPGFAGTVPGVPNDFNRLLVNYGNEKLYAHIMSEMFESPREVFDAQEIKFPDTKFASNHEILSVLSNGKNGLLPLIDNETAAHTPDEKIVSKVYEKFLDSGVLVSANSKKLTRAFGVHHFAGIVEYDSLGLGDFNRDILQSSFITLIRGDPENPGTSSMFLRNVFSDKIIATRKSGERGIVSGTPKGRFPSLRRKNSKANMAGDDENEALDASMTVGHLYRSEVNMVLDTLCVTQPWFIHCLSPLQNGKPSVDALEKQVRAYDLGALVGHPAAIYTSTYSFDDFVSRYKLILHMYDRDAKRGCESLIRSKHWKTEDAIAGKTAIFLSEKTWLGLELKLKEKEDELEAAKAPAVAEVRLATEVGKSEFTMNDPVSNLALEKGSPFNDSFGENASEVSDDSASHYESEFGGSSFELPRGTDLEGGRYRKSKLGVTVLTTEKSEPPKPKKELTRLRKNWVCFTWSTTWCFLPICLSICGKMRDRDRQMAWREKFALCMIILFMNIFVLFIIIGIGYIICPPSTDLSPGQLSSYTGPSNGKVFMYGRYYSIPDAVNKHISNYMPALNSNFQYFETSVLGRDVTYMFPVQNWASAVGCSLSVPSGFQLRYQSEVDSVWFPHTQSDWNSAQGYNKGQVVVNQDWVNQMATANNPQANYIIINDNVYDMTPLLDTQLNPSQTAKSIFLGTDFLYIIKNASSVGTFVDVTNAMNSFKAAKSSQYNQVMGCLNGIFKVGGVDHRNDLICIVPNYILLAFSVILVSVIGFKFFAALQFPGKRTPEDHDKFVICQVPCYTEGEASLRRTIDTLCNLRYDDKHKLLFLICDGMIIGSGNDRPTPRIVLDILGADPEEDPESMPFQSLGDGNDQLNMGKVYSGLYQFNGHVVPYIVVVKVGKPSERKKPGNRGKRDSQLILMKFLSKVHFNQAMSPLELGMYHHMKNIIGVDPSFYEYVFMVDADTQVHEDSLNYLVSHMIRDSKVAGTCGETSIANDRKSFTSMIQVYEYFISHHMAKAFESLFGSVTCLPGCFCMYRIRTNKNVPVLIAPGLIAEYAENTVDTLHLKNLLHLGEDRYLTTLTMKHFPNMRTTFCPEAKCQTYAPDQWPVLLSQRRRWINSTVHNLFELLRLSELCGFCCISLRFVVFVDLIATFIQPSSLIYIGYLVYMVATNNLTNIPVVSLVLIAAVFGFQIFIFLLKTQWQHIGWMIFYLMAIPAFGIYIPIYSFWHFDDFSWGNTRLAVGETNQTQHDVKETAEFDPATVPLVKWSEHENGKDGSSSDGKSYGGHSTATSVYEAPSVAGEPVGIVTQPRFPTDEELLQEIRHILSTTDLMKITKKSVRDRLSRLFGVDVASRKEYIHYCIDSILKGEL